jgi:hypothetical protein
MNDGIDLMEKCLYSFFLCTAAQCKGKSKATVVYIQSDAVKGVFYFALRQSKKVSAMMESIRKGKMHYSFFLCTAPQCKGKNVRRQWCTFRVTL